MIEFIEVDRHSLEEYGRIPMAFDVKSIFKVGQNGDGSFTLTEVALDSPYIKDYDVPDQRPTEWRRDFDLSNWGFFLCRLEGKVAGAAAVTFDTPGIELLEGRSDLAILWDIRVVTDARGRGLGRALLQAAEEWARRRNCIEMKIETQNNNVPACRFYEHLGYSLREARHGAYQDFPEEIQLLWYKDLPRHQPMYRA